MFAELIGTAILVTGVVGSGIAASRLSSDVGLQLLMNAFATAGVLVAVILAVGPVSGAHLNPVITLIDRTLGGVSNVEVASYVIAQIVGACLGAIVANLMFDLPAVNVSEHVRSTGPLWLGEVVATFGLALVVFGVVRSKRASVAPFAVAAYIAGAYLFTSSTSFANPAVTIGRTLSDTFAGISPSSVPAFIGFQLVGGALGLAAIRILYPNSSARANEVIVAHESSSRKGDTDV